MVHAPELLPVIPLHMICSLCDSASVEFLDLGRQPMANKYPVELAEKEEFFDVKVYFCPECKNVQLGTTVSRETMFVDYYYLSSVNKALVKHYEEFAFTLKDAKFVLDIGSNDGISLKPLKEMGVRALGIDPSVNVGKLANEAGFETVMDFFNAESARRIEEKYGKPDVITGLSMFSHLQDPHTFLEDVKSLLTDDGKFVVEVEYNVQILAKSNFERFYLDRIFYFSATSFDALFRKHGMVLIDAELTDIHGGSIRVTAQKTGEQNKRTKALIELEKVVLTEDSVKKSGEDAGHQIRAFKQTLEDYRAQGLEVAAYGCPARTATLTNFGNIGIDLIKYIVDDSPLKQGRFSPGKHIPIMNFSPLMKPDVWVIFAWEYFEDIKKRLTGRFLFPIPPREV